MEVGMAIRGVGVRGELNSNSLQAILQTKRRALELQLSSLQAQSQLQSRLTSLTLSPSPHLLYNTLRNSPHTAIIAEVARLSPAESPHSLATRCKDYVQAGADAIAVRTDEEVSPDGLADLVAVCSALEVPVIRTDWFLHPLQIAETREAGAAALILVYAILQNGFLSFKSYSISLGLDSIIEVVNLKELEAVSRHGISLYGINLSIKLSLPVPGLRQDVAKSLLKQLPDGAQSIVGITSMDEALDLKLAGASAIYLRHDVWQGTRHGELAGEAFLKELRNIFSNS